MAVEEAKLNEFLGRFVGDLGATVHAANVVIGDQLGLYKALADAGPSTPAELAKRTGTAERYVAEWLPGQAAGGYATYQPAAATTWTTSRRSRWPTRPARRSCGVGWHEHNPEVFQSCERFFRPGYAANLVSAWIPSLAGP